MIHEAQMHETSCFVTLTYDDEHLPKNRSLDVAHWQTFAKTARKAIGPFRFYHCGEYGPENLRPHYHAVIFGKDFRNREPWARYGGPSSHTYTSEELKEIWGKGFVTVGPFTPETAAYTARYVTTKVTGDQADSHYERLNQETGEVWRVKPDYSTMSRRPGLGQAWLGKYRTDVYPSDDIVHAGKHYPTPKYYDDLVAKEEPQLIQNMIKKRREWHKEKQEDLTPERLKQIERVMEAKIVHYNSDKI